ncbi:MAG TPA: RNA-binding S4 domain-containing protein [Thermodesulfobacteriota bacterium]|nr:RNA-binding S4 domain-containing protein [Thermodesulfobacteriota bacterium]HNU71557.1 RNA-binding S4 domain-containing protein [Thermodesulfobacteriota bacterium]HOC39393.1 RNA-binding S4 domain-containing protein [Thermodesulfobacteriota bacterium]
MDQTTEKTIRLDKWLKIARIFKTRTLAVDACDQGRVKINGSNAKAAKNVKVGDLITVKISTHYRDLTVLDIVFKSIAAKEARELYREERTETIPDDVQELIRLMKQARTPHPPKYRGRPSKKDRRELEKIRGH